MKAPNCDLATLATGLTLLARRTLALMALGLLAHCLAAAFALLAALFRRFVRAFSFTSTNVLQLV